MPVEETAAMFLFDVAYVTLSVEVSGLITGFSVVFWPFLRVMEDFRPLIFVVVTLPD